MSTANLPEVIKAVHQLDPNTSVLTLEETPLPTASGPNEHLIQIKAVSPARDELTWEVNFPSLYTLPRERVPCAEGAGIVITSPANGNSPFKPGDEVFFRLDAWVPGNLREYSVARTGQLALKPKSIGWVEAGATPLSSCTAYQGLFRHGVVDCKALTGDKEALQKNSKLRLLVTGAGGGVGSWAVQLAAVAGVGGIVAVCGPSKVEDVLKAGATETIDYSKQSIADWARESGVEKLCDIALDCVGGDSLAGCWYAVKENGVLLSAVEDPDSRKPEALEEKQLAKSTWFLIETSGHDLTEIAAVVDAGKAAPWIDSVYEFDHFDEAFKRVHSGKTKGKVVIKVNC